MSKSRKKRQKLKNQIESEQKQIDEIRQIKKETQPILIQKLDELNLNNKDDDLVYSYQDGNIALNIFLGELVNIHYRNITKQTTKDKAIPYRTIRDEGIDLFINRIKKIIGD